MVKIVDVRSLVQISFQKYSRVIVGTIDNKSVRFWLKRPNVTNYLKAHYTTCPLFVRFSLGHTLIIYDTI